MRPKSLSSESISPRYLTGPINILITEHRGELLAFCATAARVVQLGAEFGNMIVVKTYLKGSADRLERTLDPCPAETWRPWPDPALPKREASNSIDPV